MWGCTCRCAPTQESREFNTPLHPPHLLTTISNGWQGRVVGEPDTASGRVAKQQMNVAEPKYCS